MARKPSQDMIEASSNIRWLPVAKMQAHPNAQAPFVPGRSEKIAAEFDIEALGTPTVNLLDGTWWIVDGQHRIGALHLIGYGDQQIEVRAYEGLSVPEMARLFLKLNASRTPNAMAKFKNSCEGGLERELAIQATVQKQGLKVGTGNGDGTIKAVAALGVVYDRAGADVLGKALRIIRDAYGNDRKSYQPSVIKGIGLVVQRYDDAKGAKLQEALVAEKLGKLGGVHTLTSRADFLKRQLDRSTEDCTAGAVVDIVNQGRGRNRLESWWS